MCGSALHFRPAFIINSGLRPDPPGVAQIRMAHCRKAKGLPHIKRHSRRLFRKDKSNTLSQSRVAARACPHLRRSAIYLSTSQGLTAGGYLMSVLRTFTCSRLFCERQFICADSWRRDELSINIRTGSQLSFIALRLGEYLQKSIEGGWQPQLLHKICRPARVS